jgi:hypothetical protein
MDSPNPYPQYQQQSLSTVSAAILIHSISSNPYPQYQQQSLSTVSAAILIHIISSNPDWISPAVRSEVFGLLTSVSVTPAHVCGGMKEPFYE